MKDLTVVIPCYKENPEIVLGLICEIKLLGAEVIVVDDGGHLDIPYDLEHYIIRNPVNMGYGYSLKRGIREASTPYVCTMDGDGQHSVDDVVKLYKTFKLIDNCSMIVGCRWSIKDSPLRWIARKAINFVACLVARHYLIDLNSGMRIFNRQLAIDYEPILCDTFSFTTSLTLCMVVDKCKVAWFPIDVKPRAYGNSKVKLLQHGLITLWYIIYIGGALRTRRLRAKLRHILGR